MVSFPPPWVVAIEGLFVAVLLILRARKRNDGTKISRAIAWLFLCLAYIYLTAAGAGNPWTPIIVRAAIAFLALVEAVNHLIIWRFGKSSK